MEKEQAVDFLDHFSELEDPRIERKKLYSMEEILLLTLCAVICGAEGWQDVEDYGKLKIEFLRQFLPYKNGIPSDDTVRRFYRAVDSTVFQECFVKWVRSLNDLFKGRIIAIDGKTSRHSFDTNKRPLHMVSAFASEARLVLAQQKVKDKSNEITAIPEILEWLELNGAIVTIDAMGCQKSIAQKICDKEGNYILALKGNQSRLHEDVRLFYKDESLKKEYKIYEYEDVDAGHGRIEKRICYVTDQIEWLKKDHEWKGLNSIVKIKSIREIGDSKTEEDRYYISSLPADPAKTLQAIRSHWGIENSLHWVLDMSFGEDQSRIRKKNAPQNMAILRHIALNLLQRAKPKRQSIKRLRKMAGWDNQTLVNILGYF